MKTSFLAALAVPAVALGVDARGDQGKCIADWSVAARVVEQERLASVGDVTRGLRSEDGNVVKTALCRFGDVYAYRLTIRDRNGGLRNVTVNARKPLKAGMP